MNERPRAICVDTGVLTASLRVGAALAAATAPTSAGAGSDTAAAAGTP